MVMPDNTYMSVQYVCANEHYGSRFTPYQLSDATPARGDLLPPLTLHVNIPNLPPKPKLTTTKVAIQFDSKRILCRRGIYSTMLVNLVGSLSPSYSRNVMWLLFNSRTSLTPANVTRNWPERTMQCRLQRCVLKDLAPITFADLRTGVNTA